MSYQVLARKWRPRKFSEIVGQEHVVRSLINALQHDRLHHAYLFTGTRGVGKTTLARILAKAVNCEIPQDYEPCGRCPICRDVDEGRFLDLIEVDAASRTKVEDTRDLLENAQYAPHQGRYKVYLIDEVHMLSTHSFNALLKTLEEPPSHVKFLLATTDPHKIPVTVLSRCLQFNLKRLSQDQILGQLSTVLQHENIAFDRPALKVLARAADGSMRDALSLLDQAIVYGNGRVAADDVEAMLGVVAQQPVNDLLFAIAKQDVHRMMEIVGNLADLAADFTALMRQFLQALHAVAVLQQTQAVIEIGIDPETLSEIAGLLPPEDVQLYYQIALLGQKDLDLAPDPRSGFEMTLLRMLAFRPVSPKLENIPSPSSLQIAAEAINSAPTAIQKPPSAVPSSPLPASTDIQDWPTMIAAMRLESMTKQLAQHCVLHSFKENICTLVLDPTYQSMLTPMRTDKLQDALRQLIGQNLKLIIKTGKPENATPAEQRLKAQAERQHAANESIESDPTILSLKAHFGACVVPGTVEPNSNAGDL